MVRSVGVSEPRFHTAADTFSVLFRREKADPASLAPISGRLGQAEPVWHVLLRYRTEEKQRARKYRCTSTPGTNGRPCPKTTLYHPIRSRNASIRVPAAPQENGSELCACLPARVLLAKTYPPTRSETTLNGTPALPTRALLGPTQNCARKPGRIPV